MRTLLIGLVFVLSAGGVFLMARRNGGGVELRYEVRFPAGFAGDRKAAGLEVVKVLGARLDHYRQAWMAFVDRKGLITFRIAAGPERVPSLRRILEAEGRLEAYEMAAPGVRAYSEETGTVPPGYREIRLTEALPRLYSRPRVGEETCLVRELPVFGSEIVVPIVDGAPPIRWESPGSDPVLLLDLKMDLASKYVRETRSPGAEDLLIFVEGKPRSITPIDDIGLDGYLWIPGVKDETEAEELETSLSHGRRPYPIGEPDVSTFRGKLR